MKIIYCIFVIFFIITTQSIIAAQIKEKPANTPTDIYSFGNIVVNKPQVSNIDKIKYSLLGTIEAVAAVGCAWFSYQILAEVKNPYVINFYKFEEFRQNILIEDLSNICLATAYSLFAVDFTIRSYESFKKAILVAKNNTLDENKVKIIKK